MSDYYESLGVSRDASPEQIKKAFREKAFESHPDRNSGNPAAEEKFKKINEAYSTLGDAEKKARYDAGGYATDDYRRPAGSGENPYGQYTWTYYGPFGQGGTSQDGGFNPGKRGYESYSRQEVLELLLRSVLTVVVGVLLFRFAYLFGMLGILICVTAIGRGLMNSLRAINLLINLKK